MVRDMMIRYGRGNIGFVWVVVEPALLTSLVLILWTTIHIEKMGVHVIDLVLTGYMLLTLWRHMTNHMIGLLRNSSGMLYHRNITLLDIVLRPAGVLTPPRFKCPDC